LLQLETFVITSDIDIIPLSPSYFHDNAKHSSDSFIVYRNVIEEHRQYPICYCAALPKVWKDIFKIHSVSDIENTLKSWFPTQETWIVDKMSSNWARDQLQLYDMVQRWNKNIVIVNETSESFSRLDRDNLPTKPAYEYSDYHMPRPFNQEKMNSILNRLGITVFIIHYSKLTERRKNIETLLKNAGIDKYIFVDQFDRENLTPDSIDANYQYNGVLNRQLMLSEISNFMAHRWCFEQVANMKPNEVGLILEDDAIFKPSFKADIITLIKDLPVYWDFACIGSNQPITESENIEAVVNVYSNSFTGGYLLNHKLAKRLVKHSQVQKIGFPIDDALGVILKDMKAFSFITSKRLIIEGSTEEKVFKSNMGRSELFHNMTTTDFRSLVMLGYFRNHFHNSVFEFGCNCISTRFFSEFFNRALSVEVDNKQMFETEVKHKTSRNDILYIPDYTKAIEFFEMINFNFELVYINNMPRKEEYLNKAFNRANTIIVVGFISPCILPANYTCVRYDNFNVSIYTNTGLDFFELPRKVYELNDYSTYLPILNTICDNIACDDIFEFEIENYSTPLFAKKFKNVLAVEMQSQEWYDSMFKQNLGKNVELICALGEKPALDILRSRKAKYSMIFVDGHGGNRWECINESFGKTDVIVAHDTETSSYNWHLVRKPDNYTWLDICEYNPWTSVITTNQALIAVLKEAFPKSRIR
jgi:hypothetical protein